jgi:hypothetical protein
MLSLCMSKTAYWHDRVCETDNALISAIPQRTCGDLTGDPSQKESELKLEALNNTSGLDS